MARSCPLCPSQALSSVMASDVEVEVCPRCHGMWFDGGELERFPDRPSVRPFLPAARQAASRCRKLGHLVPRSLAACASCRSLPVGCPACGARLSLVVTSACAIDVCVQCEGVWLDAGEFELLQGVTGPAPTKTAPEKKAAASGWEVPEATAVGPDLWRGPGSDRPLHPLPLLEARLSSASTMACAHCGRQTSLGQAWAKDGDVYCGDCRPAGATSGARLPKDSSGAGVVDAALYADDAFDLVSWLSKLFKRFD